MRIEPTGFNTQSKTAVRGFAVSLSSIRQISSSLKEPGQFMTELFCRAGFRASPLLTPPSLLPWALPQQEHLEEHLCAGLHLVSHHILYLAVFCQTVFCCSRFRMMTISMSSYLLWLCVPLSSGSSLMASVTVTALFAVMSEALRPASTGRTCSRCVQAVALGCCSGPLSTGAVAAASCSSPWRWRGWPLWSSWGSWNVSWI